MTSDLNAEVPQQVQQVLVDVAQLRGLDGLDTRIKVLQVSQQEPQRVPQLEHERARTHTHNTHTHVHTIHTHTQIRLAT